MKHFVLHSVIPCSRAILENLILAQLVDKFPTLFSFEVSFPCPLPEPDESFPLPLVSASLRYILVRSSHLRLVLAGCFFS
jgi:hypothetical protein